MPAACFLSWKRFKMSEGKKNKVKVARKKGMVKNLWSYRELYLMMVPGILYLLINNYMPIGGLSLAFKKYDYSKGIAGSPWNGLSEGVKNSVSMEF